jgi:rare lipoprotein A
MDLDRKSLSLRVVVAALSLAAGSNASANPMAISHAAFPITTERAVWISPPEGETIIGIASFYDTPGELTSSGEIYDGNAFTAAAQLEIRDRFGGIYYGRKYRPSYAIAEFNGKRAILKFNDVGPLRPGRKFDLSRAAMEHFGGIERGLLPDFKIVLLPPGQEYTPGPLVDVQLASMTFGDAQFSDPQVTLPAAQYLDIGPDEKVEEAVQVAEAAAPATVAPTIDISGASEMEIAAGDEVVARNAAERDDADGPVSSIGASGTQDTALRTDDDVVDNCSH